MRHFLSFLRWYNLTITNPSHDNLGDYMCVAENSGGLMEQRVTLTFDDPSSITIGGGGRRRGAVSVVILYGTVSASVFFLGILTVSLCYWRFKHRQRLHEKAKSRTKFVEQQQQREMAPFGGAASGSGANAAAEYQVQTPFAVDKNR